VESLDRRFQYKIPQRYEESITIGTPVKIPFGKGNRVIKGYVVGISDVPKWDTDKMKYITEIEKRGISASEQLLTLAYWIKEKYGSTFNEAIRTVLPVKKSVKSVENRIISLKLDKDKAKSVLAELEGKKNAAARVRLLKELIDREYVYFSEVKSRINISMQTVNSLLAAGVINIDNERVYRNPVNSESCADEPDRDVINLNSEQQMVVSSIVNDYQSGKRDTHLIHGVTGSGKTEVYMSIMDYVISQGKQVIMLIPEIALTYQTVNRFYKRFGDRVSILNSRMSAGERFDQYERVSKGEIDIIIGPRSALFVPFERLGLIVIDEEHEDSYKSEKPPKYHAREVAIKRAELSGAMVILGSATPSIDSYYKSELPENCPDRFIRHELNYRAVSQGLPLVNVVDMREEFAAKNYSMFSNELRTSIGECLSRREQIILFINRRGFLGFVSCRSCGQVIKCPHCDISLTIHNVKENGNASRNGSGQAQKMICHYCGYEQPMIKQCPSCESKYIGGFGIGTQQVEQMLVNTFPGIRVLRMDADTTSGKEGHSNILKQFAAHEADVLLGTQMIVKGHDYPLVTLVGVLAADLSLNMNDYRAAEKTFELLVQASGRAGRGQKPGKVVIQTYQPDNYAIERAAKQDYRSFYEQEIMYRRLMKYPPCAGMMSVFVAGVEDDEVYKIISKASHVAEECIKSGVKATVIGPSRHPVSRVNDRYRYIMYIKGENVSDLIDIRNCIDDAIGDCCSEKECVVQYDMT